MVMAYIVIACIVIAYIVMACIVMPYILRAYIVMAYIVMAYIVRHPAGGPAPGCYERWVDSSIDVLVGCRRGLRMSASTLGIDSWHRHLRRWQAGRRQKKVVWTRESTSLVSAGAAGLYLVMAYAVMAYVVMAYVVMAYVVMAYVVMAYIFMAYIVMAFHIQVC